MRSHLFLFFIIFIVSLNFLGCPWDDEDKYVVRQDTMHGTCIIMKENDRNPGYTFDVTQGLKFDTRQAAKDWICSHRGTGTGVCDSESINCP